MLKNNNGMINTTFTRQTSPSGAQFDTSTVDRKAKNGPIFDGYNSQMQNEHAWAIDRRRAGAKCDDRRSNEQYHSLRFLESAW